MIYNFSKSYVKLIKKKITYPNIATAGTVMAAPSRNTAPGSTVSVAIYTREYSGPYTSGIMASARPNKEFTLPARNEIIFVYKLPVDKIKN